jgi:hypothetical protein
MKRGALRVKPETSEAKRFKREVRERDNYTCRWPGCNYSSRSIHAHHINERSQRPDLRYDIKNGAAICPQHHDGLHHTVAGREEARRLGLLGGESYEKAQKAA